MKKRIITLIICLQCSCLWAQNKAVFTVQADKATAEISPNMWGIFFEDINLGAE